MTRLEVAIRDFYDIDGAFRRLDLRISDTELVKLAGRQPAIPGSDPADVSDGRLAYSDTETSRGVWSNY